MRPTLCSREAAGGSALRPWLFHRGPACLRKCLDLIGDDIHHRGLAASLIHARPRIAAGKPSVLMLSTATCLIWSSVTPAVLAFRTAECVPPSSPAARASATFTMRLVFSSSGPAL